MELSNHFANDCLYRIIHTRPKTIEINKKWINYLLRNYRILIDFCYWNLTLYLQDKNPNVPDIPNKLIKPMERSPLTRQRKFWRGVLDERRMESEQVFCIYTATPLGAGNFAVEHFIPYSFVSHDLLWNLVPVDPAICRRPISGTATTSCCRRWCKLPKTWVLSIGWRNRRVIEDVVKRADNEIISGYSVQSFRDIVQPIPE